MAGNAVLVLATHFLLKKDLTDGKGLRDIKSYLKAIVCALLKGVFMGLTIALWLLPTFISEESPLIKKMPVFQTTFSTTQFITACIGFVYAFIIWGVEFYSKKSPKVSCFRIFFVFLQPDNKPNNTNKMKTNVLKHSLAAVCCMGLAASCTQKAAVVESQELTTLNTVGNPYLPLWEHIPDGEPYVFDDPDNPGKQRVYIYGSHDNLKDAYCGRDQVVWSAPTDDLSHWRYDGIILTVNRNARGEVFDSAATADVLYAPDITFVTDSTGKKTYYLFPNDQTGYRNALIAKSDRPDGPFEVCNWSKKNPNQVEGIYGFDPAVFVDDDGRVYGYWGFEHSYAAEIDPATMCTVKPGTEIIDGMVSGRNEEGIFSFFEASSIRKIKDKYVFIYSRFTKDGEFGLPTSNYNLAYAYSDQPLGPWTYGGTIIDARGREINEKGDTIASAVPDGNTHGSICEINGQWYVFYHRQTGTNEYARQARGVEFYSQGT